MRVLKAGCGFGGTLACLNERVERLDLVGLNIDQRQQQRAEVLAQPQRGNLPHLFAANAGSATAAGGL